MTAPLEQLRRELDEKMTEYVRAVMDELPPSHHLRNSVVIGWVAGVQMMYVRQGGVNHDVLIPLTSEGMSLFTAMGVSSLLSDAISEKAFSNVRLEVDDDENGWDEDE